MSRGIVLLDHEDRDEVPGLITITGGKLTTARLMAEQTTDLVCRKLGVNVSCTTATTPLPGSEPAPGKIEYAYPLRGAIGRHGTEITRMDFDERGSELVCECEQVNRAEIVYAIREFGVRDLKDLRRHTRIGMGTCQGSFCMQRAAEILAAELAPSASLTEQEAIAKSFVRDYLQERWKGITPVLWGETLREAEFMRAKHLKEGSK